MLKKTGLSLLISLGVLSASEITSPDNAADQGSADGTSLVLSPKADVVNADEGSPRASTGPKPKARNSKRGPQVAELAVADAEKTDSDSDGSASEKDANQGPRAETVVFATQLPETQLMETQLVEPSDRTLTDGATSGSDVLATETPAEDTKEVGAMTQVPEALDGATSAGAEVVRSDAEESDEEEESEESDEEASESAAEEDKKEEDKE